MVLYQCVRQKAANLRQNHKKGDLVEVTRLAALVWTIDDLQAAGVSVGKGIVCNHGTFLQLRQQGVTALALVNFKWNGYPILIAIVSTVNSGRTESLQLE